MKQTRFYYFVMVLAVGEVLAIAAHAGVVSAAPWVFWLLLPLAAFRLGRTVAFNAVGLPLRERWTLTEPDGSGAGDTVNPKPGSGLGELLACPVCAGTHAAALILALYGFAPSVGLAAAAVFGAAGGAELLHWLACDWEWRGNLEREDTGARVRDRAAPKLEAVDPLFERLFGGPDAKRL